MRNDASPSGRTLWGDRIVRLLAGRPQSWLVRQTGLSSSTLADIITKNTPSADRAVRIAQALGTTVEYLMMGESGQPDSAPGMAEPAHGFAQAAPQAVRSVADRYREALLELEEATQAAAVIPDEGLKEVLVGLLFKYRIPVEDVVLILATKARKAS